MIKTIEAMFDGRAFLPVEPIELEANTRVRLIVETVSLPKDEPVSFLQTARSLNLDGPTDWSANLDKYLYGEEIEDENGEETESSEK